GRQAHLVPHLRGHERRRDDLHVPGLRQRTRHRTLTPLLGGETTSCRSGGQGRRDGVVTLQSQHFFHQVGRLLQVRTPGRRLGHHQTGAVGGGRSEEHTSELQSRENLVC